MIFIFLACLGVAWVFETPGAMVVLIGILVCLSLL